MANIYQPIDPDDEALAFVNTIRAAQFKQALDIAFDKWADLSKSLELVREIRDPVVPNSPWLLAASQVRPIVRGFFGRINADYVGQLIFELDEEGLLPPGMHHASWADFVGRFGHHAD